MRSSRGQNPPPPGDASAAAGAPEPDDARENAPRRADAPSWFAPLPPAETPRAERPRGAASGENRSSAPEPSRSRPAPDDLDPDDLYPPEYRVGGRGEPFRTDMLPRPPSLRTSEQFPRQRPSSGDERRTSPRDPSDRPARAGGVNDWRPAPRPEWYREDTSADPPISERFGYRSPEGTRDRPPPPPPRNPPLSAYWEEREEQRKIEESGRIPRIPPPAPDANAYGPASSSSWPSTPSGRPPANLPPRAAGDAPFTPYSGQFAMPPVDRVAEAGSAAIRTSGSFAYPRVGERESGGFRTAPLGTDMPGRGGGNGVDAAGAPGSLTRSGRLATTGRPGTSGAFATVPVAPSRPARTSAPGATPVRRALLADPVVLPFLALALVITGAMIAFVALRYNTFPQQITLHFGPAGASQRDRIGDRQELWTIPFIAAIVFVANTTLAFVFDFFDRQDRFVPRLLTIGSTLVATVAWVVLLTLLYR